MTMTTRAWSNREWFNHKWLNMLWTLAVLAAGLVALPLLLMWAIVVLVSVAFGSSGGELIMSALWFAAGLAGLAGLVVARGNRPDGIRTIRTRQALLAAGIVAALPVVMGPWLTFLASPGSDPGFRAVMSAVAVAFAILIVQAVADIRRLQGPAAKSMRVGAHAIPACFLGLAMLCAVAALVGHVLLEISVL